ncbi:MAG: PAS domain S-box protein, partial [Planctomycetota bacterium]|nr:PAS domain S-box protein [Planctomycetota bacterium]
MNRAITSSSAMLAVDRELRIRSWPVSAEALFGCTRDEVLGKPAFDLLACEIGDPAAEIAATWRACRFRGKTAGRTPLRVAFEPTHTEDDLPFGMLFVEHETAAAAEAEARYQSIIASMQEGVIVTGLDGEILTWNSAAEHILDMTALQLHDRSVLQPVRRTIRVDGSPFLPEDYPGIVTARTGVPQTNVVMGVERSDGSMTWISINSQPISRAGEPHHAVVSTFTDITERRAAEQRLREALDNVKALRGL